MKSNPYVFFLRLLVLFLFSIFFNHSGYLFSEIRDSHHDFSERNWNPEGDFCVHCHTPHNASTTVENSPLWNHDLSAAVYQPYVSSTLDASIGQPTGKSKLCLSCHDGTVAWDSYGGRSGIKFLSWAWQMGNIGTNLMGEHPISFEYSTALANADGELHDPSTTGSGLGGTIEEDLLENGRMECTSCHDVHISRNIQGCNGCHFPNKPTLSLWKSNANSAFCLTCHDK